MSMAIAQMKQTQIVGRRSLTFTGIYLILQFNPTLISPDVFLQWSILQLTLPLPSYHVLSLTLSLSLSLSLSLRYLALFPSISV